MAQWATRSLPTSYVHSSYREKAPLDSKLQLKRNFWLFFRQSETTTLRTTTTLTSTSILTPPTSRRKTGHISSDPSSLDQADPTSWDRSGTPRILECIFSGPWNPDRTLDSTSSGPWSPDRILDSTFLGRSVPMLDFTFFDPWNPEDRIPGSTFSGFFKKWANSGLFFLHFRSFQTINTIFTANQCEKCPVHPAYCAGIWTRSLSNKRCLP